MNSPDQNCTGLNMFTTQCPVIIWLNLCECIISQTCLHALINVNVVTGNKTLHERKQMFILVFCTIRCYIQYLHLVTILSCIWTH